MKWTPDPKLEPRKKKAKKPIRQVSIKRQARLAGIQYRY